MKKRILLPFAFVLLIGCSGGSQHDKPMPSDPDGALYQQGQEDAFNLIIELSAAVDPATMMLRDSIPNVFRFKKMFEKEFRGKKFCNCGEPHITGQSHTHQDKLTTSEGKETIIGLLKKFEPQEQGVVKPCYFPFVNNNRATVKPCQHLTDKGNKDYFDSVCIGPLWVAFNLRPQDDGDHHDIPDCHKDSVNIHSD